jgi:hypothetical protein
MAPRFMVKNVLLAKAIKLKEMMVAFCVSHVVGQSADKIY